MNLLKKLHAHAYAKEAMREMDEMFVAPESLRRAYAERLVGRGTWPASIGREWLQDAEKAEQTRSGR